VKTLHNTTITNAVAFLSTVLDLPLPLRFGLCKIGLLLLQVYILMPDGSMERKNSSETMNAIWKTYN